MSQQVMEQTLGTLVMDVQFLDAFFPDPLVGLVLATAAGEGWVNIISPDVDPTSRFPRLFESLSPEPLTENQRALPVFRKRP